MKHSWIIRLAGRNLLRYARRTLITASAIAFGLMFYIYVDSILTGADDESKRNLRRYETADGALAPPGYLDTRKNADLEPAFDWERVSPALDAAGIVHSPRIPFDADLVFFKDPFPEDGHIPVRIVALDPVRDSEVFRLDESLAEGAWLEPGQEGIVLGRWVARSIGAEIGHWLVVFADARDGFPTDIELEVVGILDSPNPEVNNSGVYIPIDLADEFLGMDGEVPVLHFRLPGAMPMDGIPERYVSVSLPGNLDWYTWEELAADYVLTMEAETQGSASIIILILIIAGVGISNTMLMAVLERRREVGMMRSMGMNDRHIRRLFLWESAGIGLVGSILGTGIGALVNIPMVINGLDFTFFFQENTFGYRISGIFYGAWHWQGFVYAFILGIGLSVLIALISIRRILRLGIVESLRYV